MSSSIPSLIICGSQTIPPTSESLDQLASYLTRSQRSPELRPLVEAIRALPEVWAALKIAEPSLQALSNAPVLSLRDWLSSPSSSLHPDITSNSGSDGYGNSYSRLTVPATLPNVLLAPLTVVIHLAQYIHYLDDLSLDLGLEGAAADAHVYIREAFAATPPAQSPDTGIDTASKFQGLCIGTISAVVMECSSTRTELGRNAATALRLAMCIGAYVDSKRALAMSGSNCSLNPSFEIVCFIARWGVESGREDVEAILSRYPEAYISVELDKNSVTITAPERDSPSLRRELNSQGVRVTDIPVRGGYHSSKNEQLLQRLLDLSSSDPTSPFWVPWGIEKLERCLRSILTEQADWFSNISKTISSISHNSIMTVLELGLVSCFPPSLSVLPHHRILRGSLPLPAPQVQDQDQDPYNYPETSVAIIGAACEYPGASSLDQLWTLISTGQVMFSEALPGRFKETVAGNFISDFDQFDCGLFDISPREATYMDPQQRIALQVAYRAIESSGYFACPDPELDVGCYVGVGSSDYEHNVNSNMPTAYSFTGTSRAFISGRISHFFKWTGPSITFDTACSSSATAIHQACNGIAMGDCSVALAGGVHIMASLPADRNIAAAGMTNSTGPCRPFDSDAAGYSRGEGCGFLVLKRLSAALACGDHILGVMVATATNQSNGSSSITVPISQSQSDLYRRALSRATLSAADISYVEAHGTGTQRGDPVEYQSIREVFGGKQKVHIGSVKANIGHTEGASGVAGVLKVLMMLRHGQIPPQTNFASLNPAIPVQEHEDQLVISTRLQKWDRKFRAACVNNYGAAGNNTAIIICEPSRDSRMVKGELTGPAEPRRYPFLISAQSPVSLRRYCATLAQYIEAKSPSLAEVASLVARQQNRNLRHRIVISAASMPELQDHLRRHAQTEDTLLLLFSRQSKPIVLVFGGQTGSTLHFSKAVYDATYHLRQHVDKCHALIQQMGLSGLFPYIFSQDPIDDVVMLHCCLFTIQYACAAAWLDVGLSVHKVIGHSFGQLTAMCISGIITLEDALRLVVGRAELIRDCWGDEKGCMLSVDIDREGAQTLVQSEPGIELACYNGPTNHVLVGSERAVANVERRSLSSSLRTRRLKTTHGFHSHLINPLMSKYLDLVRTVSIKAPLLAIETCSETTTWRTFTAQLVAEHSRRPVYFCDAVQRIERELGPCVWLEAGSGSGAVMLAKQSLRSKSNSLCGLQLGSSKGRNPLDSVVNATLELWNQGTPVQCWLYHPRNLIHSKGLVGLPGYQFDTSSHWLTFVEPEVGMDLSLKGVELISPVYISYPEPHVCRFELNQENQGLVHILAGRKVLGESLWPLALYMEMAAQAAALLTPSLPPASQFMRIFGLKIKTPLGARPVDGLCLRLEQSDLRAWEFSLESDCTQHALGTVILDDKRTSTGQTINYRDSNYYSLKEATVPSVFSGPGNIAYKLLEKVAEYEPAYRGIESIRMNDHEAIACVYLPIEAETGKYSSKTSCNPILLDQFLAIAEIHALSREDCKRSEVFACSGLNEATIFTSFEGAEGRPRSWSVYVRRSSEQRREIVYDILVSDADLDQGQDQNQDQGKERLVLALLGVKFLRTSTHALKQIVARASFAPTSPEIATTPLQIQEEEDCTATIWPATAKLLHELTGWPQEQILPQTTLADLGMDSLTITEFEARIKAIFNVHGPGLVELDRTVEAICDGIAAAQTSHSLASTSSSQFTLTPSGSSSSSGLSSFECGSETQAAEVSLSTSTSKSILAKIAETISAHLRTGERVRASSQLHSLGLDSLATLELQSDLQRNFGLTIHLMQLDGSATISDLHAMVMRGRSQ
ncbi:non-reducing polyketide synthase spyA [Aspergillus foveolatus]|uniref:non-reducing polyketide synthase spyA n=1 Tax=Aspergillus foveolatus TaxID=210207 RepID=UPI003CCE0EC0